MSNTASDPVVPIRVARWREKTLVLLLSRGRLTLLPLLLKSLRLLLPSMLLLPLLPVVEKEHQGQSEEDDDEALGDAVVLQWHAVWARPADGVIEYVFVVRVVIEQLVVLQEVGNPLAERPVLLWF